MKAKICECGKRMDSIDPVAHGLTAEIVGPCVCDEPGSLIARAIINRQRRIFDAAMEEARVKLEGVT